MNQLFPYIFSYRLPLFFLVDFLPGFSRPDLISRLTPSTPTGDISPYSVNG